MDALLDCVVVSVRTYVYTNIQLILGEGDLAITKFK